MRQQFRDGNFDERQVLLTVLTPKDKWEDIAGKLNDGIADVLYDLGCELVDCREMSVVPENQLLPVNRVTVVRERYSEKEVWTDDFWVDAQQRPTEQLFIDAVQTYLKTADGVLAVDFTNNDFNWGDAMLYVPTEIWNQFGIYPFDFSKTPESMGLAPTSSADIVTLQVDQDEVLIPDDYLELTSVSFTLDNGLLALVEMNENSSYDFNIWEPEADGSRGMLYSGGTIDQENGKMDFADAIKWVTRYYSQEALMGPRDIELMTDIAFMSIKAQLNGLEQRNGYDEPQAFFSLENGRSIEVVHEQDGLAEEEFYFSVLLHCSDAEYKTGEYHSTNGIMDVYDSKSNSIDELKGLIRGALVCDREHPIAEHCLSGAKKESPAPKKESLLNKIKDAANRASSGSEGHAPKDKHINR